MKLGEGELQLSHRQMRSKVYSLSEDHLSVSNGKGLTLPSGEQNTELASLDFDQTSQTVSYSQRGLATTATWQVRLASNALSKSSSNAGELRRGLDGMIHLEAGGLPMQVHTLLAPDLTTAKAGIAYRTVGQKQYELKDHLGNVRVVVGDEKLATLTQQGSSLGMELRAAVRSYFHYYPFGMNQPGGVYEGDTLRRYRFGYNGKELDRDFGNNYDYGFRIYNPRLAKFLSVDPLSDNYAWWTPYQFAGNNPVNFIDLDGREIALADWLFSRKAAQKVVNSNKLAGNSANLVQVGYGILYTFTSNIEGVANLIINNAALREKFGELALKDLAFTLNKTLCVTGDCGDLFSPLQKELITYAQVEASRYIDITSNAFNGDPYASGQVIAELALLTTDIDDAGRVGKLLRIRQTGTEIDYLIRGVEKVQEARLGADGLVSFNLNTSGVKGAGQMILDDALAGFGNKVKGVTADWGLRSDYPGASALGLKEFWSNYDLMDGTLSGNELLKYSAAKTTLGKAMAKKGYTDVKVVTAERDIVSVEFTKPKK